MDYSQICISNLFEQIGAHENTELKIDLLRHMILNSLRLYNTKLKSKYGEMIIACDSAKSWRKEAFPHYKANRKKNRDKSEIDWNLVYEAINTVREELKENFPYRTILIDRAEADDIIGVLCERFGTVLNSSSSEKILIVSADKDFIQLQKYANVEQFDPIRKKDITAHNPEEFLWEHILRGDSGDGVPNILSDDNCFVEGVRQKSLTQKKIDLWRVEGIPQELQRNFSRNKALIDLSQIPDTIKESINFSYENYTLVGRAKLFDYFFHNKLKNLSEFIEDF